MRSPPMKVENLFEEIKDGTVLLSLLEVLSGEKLPMEKGAKLRRPHHIANITTALSYLEKRNIKLVNINATSIADGKPAIVLGLVWTIILYFQIKDFGKSWKDGVAFNAMIHNIRPDLVDMDAVRRQQARINLEHAFSTAENQLGIARLLDPEDVDVERPDEKSIMTYVAQFLKAYPDAKDRSVPGEDLSTPEKESQAYNSIMTWLNTDAAEILASSQDPVTDRQAEFLDYIGFKTEFDRREPIVKKIGEKVLSGKALKLTMNDWEQLDTRWREVDDQTRRWLLKLDASLPGRLGKFGEFLYQAELLLLKEKELLANPDDNMQQLAEVLREHKDLFKDLESWRQFFIQTKRAGRYEGEMLHGPHMDLMNKRLEAVTQGSSRNQAQIEYLLCRFDVLGYIGAAEEKVAVWTAKCGRQEEVEATLADYVDMVDKQQLTQNFDKTLNELKKLAEAFKKADKAEAPKLDAFQAEAADRWKKLAAEIKGARPMLKEVIEAWKRYSACVDVLTVWLTDGEQVMEASAEEIQEYFKDLAQYEERLKVLNESGAFLVGVVTEPIAAEIKELMALLNQRCTELAQRFEQYKQTEVIGRARQEYEEGVERLAGWLSGAQEILDQQIPCIHAPLKEHLLQLDEFNNQIAQVESDFKVTTKTAQGLVKDSSQDVVSTMLQTLNTQKEVIVKLRKEIPERIKYLKAVLPNVESLETGVLDLEQWLSEGEELLASHKLDATADAAEARLEKHKNCVTSAKDWEKKLEAITRLWRSLVQRQQQLDEWLDNAQAVIDDNEDDSESLIRKHKTFFDRTDQKRLQEYQANGQEILKQLEPADQMPLKEIMTATEQRWKSVMHQAPIKLLKLEFVLPEEKFEHQIGKAELALKQHQEQLASNTHVKDALQKHRQFFHQGPFRSTCEKCLEQMKDYAAQLTKHDRADGSLQKRYQEHLDRWNKLNGFADKLHLQLKQLPERWKDYNQKMHSMSDWISNVEKLMKEMGKEDISSDEYKDMLARFQKEMRNMDKHMEEGKRLEGSLEELLQDAPDSDAAAERKRLRELMARFQGLRPDMESTMGKSSIFTKGFEFRDGVDKRSNWLDEAQRLAMESPVIDSLEDARAYLQEHEALLTKLDSEKATIQADIEAGKRLQKDRNAPAFISQTVADLDRKWRDTNQLAQAKHTKLKRKVKDWEQYEGEKTSLLQYLKKAESELEKPPDALAQDTAQKDFQSKKELQSTLNKLKGSLNEMTKLNALLCEGASRERQGPLKGEMTDIDKRLDSVAHRLNAKLADLEMTIAKWSEYYKRLNNFCDWLNEKETKLNDVYDNKQETPENQLKKAEAISSQVYENHITLENLEKDAKGLTQNFRSRETAALKSKLTSVRRQWESLCARAKDRSTALSGNVAHWQRYQTLHEQLMPWIVKAEKYCATELPKCASLEEAKDLYDLHQAFLRECEENLPIFDKMSTEAGYLMEQPNMARELDSVQKRWGNILSASEDRSHKVEKMFGAWTAYSNELENFQENLDRLQNRLASDPNVGTTDVQVLEHELALAKAMKKECGEQDPAFQALQQEFKDLIQNCSEEERAVLMDRFDKVVEGYTKMEDLIGAREDVCHQWSKYSDAHKAAQAKLKSLQARLAAPDITEEEVAKIMQEIQELRQSMSPWSQEAESLDEMMSSAQMVIKDRATQRTLHFGSELASLEHMCDTVGQTAQQKESHLGELLQLSDDFSQRKDQLVKSLKQVESRIASSKAGQSSLQGIKDLVREIEDIRDDVFARNPEYEQLRELGRQIMHADPSKAAQIQSQLGQVSEAWERVQAKLGEQHQYYSGIANLWQTYNDSKQSVGRVLEDVSPLVEQDIAFSNQNDVKRALDQHKNAEFDLHANQSQLDHMNNKGVQLLEELRKVPNFNPRVMEQDLDDINLRWETANKVLDDHKENLEAQLVCWDQVGTGKDEVGTWVTSMLSKLDESARHFDDAVSVESRLTKFKEEAPYFAEVLADVSQKISDLRELNQGQSIPALEAAQRELEEKFERASTLANQLSATMSNFSEEQQDLQRAMQEETEWLNHVKDLLSRCDDISGEDEDIIKRLGDCKSLQEELAAHKKKVMAIQDKTAALHNKYPSVEMSSLAKDANVLAKKFESLVGRAERIDDTLVGALEQHCQDAQQQQARWLAAAREKVSWCGDIGGDRYSVEAKLSTMQDLHKSMDEGERKRAEAHARLEAARSVLPRAKLAELEQQNKHLDKEWNMLVAQMDQTQSKLENSVDEWEAYDTQHEALAQWLRETEASLRSEATLKPDLAAKKNQLEVFKDLEDAVHARRHEFESMRDMAQKISHASGDTRTASYATQLVNRFQTLATAVKEQVEQSDKNIDDHQNFLQRHKACVDWLSKAQAQLDSCSDMVGDEESLNVKLSIIKDLLADKEQGLALFNAALESGEKLYPNTSNEGREEVRRELRSLRDHWEGFSDALNETQRSLESSRMQWSSFDENFEQLMQWVHDMEGQTISEPELKGTLQEKKAQLQNLKTRCQDILSHQTMMDSISDKGTALASAQVQNRLKQLNTKYNTLCSKAQAQDLMNTMRDGEAKLHTAQKEGEKTLPQTSPQGQANVRRELDALKHEWDTLGGRMKDTQQSLVHAIKALETYDVSCESLNRWLRETESQLKDYELKSTLSEKQAQVEKFKILQQQIAGKQGQFDELQNMAAQVQGSDVRLSNYSSQLISKYEAVKNMARDVIGRWQEFVEDHTIYQNNYAQCVEWVATLRKRLQICGDLAGDKQDVEDRLIKLQELMAERDEGASMIHQTVESGERLYPNTASEGRDIIRQELRSLREQWDLMCDEVSETQRKLDMNLTQWSSYDENFDTFHKWLLDVEVKLKQDAELKATLPEKKAQLQNHKVLHQDILSRKHIIENLGEKAQALTKATPSAKVNKFVGELHQKYDKICELSKSVLDRFDHAMREHQQYQDASHDFQDWLNTSREKLDMCADRSGDKMSLQAKRERIKEFSTGLAEGERKLKMVCDLASQTAKNTSPQGQDVLRREVDHLQREWDDYRNQMMNAESALDTTMMQWGSFESKFEECAEWLKNMENHVKSHELKNTLKEKQAQVDKFKKQREEILAHQPIIDQFTDEAQNLMHTSSDVRLSTQVTQLTNRYQGLLSLIKDLITKWEKYVAEHQVFDNRLAEYNNWILQASQKLEQCSQSVGDQESMEEKRAMIQMLFSEKEHGLQRLNGSIESGEKLYPDTAATGREKVRQDLRRAKEDWERLFSGLNEAQRRVDAFLMQWTSYVDGQDSLTRWMGETEAALRADMDLRNTLQEKRQQLQNYRSVLQDITSHQRLVDSCVEKAQGVLQSTSNSDVASFITSISSRYEKLASDAKAMIVRSEEHVAIHQQYQESLQASIDWLSQMKDKLSICSDRDFVFFYQELITVLPEGQAKVKECEHHAQETMDTTALKGRQAVQSEMDVLKLDWEDYSLKLHSLRDSLEQALHYWRLYEDKYERIQGWVKAMEKQVKDCPLRSTLEEKQEQLKKYQELMQEIKGHQSEIDKFTDEAQTLQQLTSESRVGNFVSQLTSRYQGLLVTTKEIIKRCEQNVEDHKTFVSKFADASQWLIKAKEKFAECSDSAGSRAELEDRLDKVQELVRDRDAGLTKLNQCVESGERLYASTAPDGRETIRQELRKLKLGWDGLYDDLSAITRRLEVSLVQWTSFDESYGQVESWLRDMESQLEGQTPLRSTLEEKKTQLQNYKDRVQQYEKFVADHQEYSDCYNSTVEWLNSVREKLSSCSDVSGDRHAIQSRLDKIQDILATKMEGEPKVKNVISLAQKVLPHTAPQGRDVVTRDTEALRADWEAFIMALAKTKSDLESCMDQWREFETWQERCGGWMKEVEGKLRDVDLRASLADKQAMLDRLRALQSEISQHQRDLDVLSDSAQDLMQVSADSRVVSQASQLATRYQTATINSKAYIQSFDQCRSWLSDMEARVSNVLDTSGDKTTVQDRLTKVQDLLAEKEEGMHMLQIALDNLQMVLPNTSVAGRDAMRRDMQALQHEYDTLSGRLMDARSSLENQLAQWTVYDDSVGQLVRWLQDLENQTAAESQLQNTMQEKKLQLERVKVLQLNIQSQQSTIDSLNEKAQTLKQSSRDDNLSNQIRHVVSRYETLCDKAKGLLQASEKQLRDHQVYRDAYMAASDWLGATSDKLNLCGDVRGDRSTIEAQLHKVEEISGGVHVGRQKLEEAQTKGSVVLPQTSTQGQDLIKEELSMLVSDYEGFETDLANLTTTLTTLRDQWHQYEAFYEELSQWIKDTESEMKSDSELKSTLEQKTIQLEKQKSLHEELMQQQESFDSLAEQAQILMQSSTDSRVSTQLTQMSSRYSALITVSKDLLKRYDQNVQDHQQYSEVYSEARSWLQDTYDKLSVCADTSGDRYTIQTQLEKLQEFVVMKEEGQVLIHTANTWGEKTMTNTSAEGREVIRQELQQLQADWEQMLSHVTDTKVMLESCLLQWTDFSASHDQVVRWLKDMEKRLRETHLKADLGEKKAELQRCKDMLAKNEQYVAQHQTFHDSCNSFVNWLRTAVEKLATCSDTYGEKSAIESKLERAKALMASLSEGSQRLSQATKAGETTLPSTSASGQTKIRHELQVMTKDFEDFRTHLVQAQSDLEMCLSQWDEFEESYQQFCNWLREAEVQLRAETVHKATVEEKKRHWDEYQVQLEELISHQSALDQVSEKAQVLLQTNADAKTSHAITQLNTRYQAIIALAKDICNNLEAAYNHHRMYKQNHHQFADWLKETRQHIKAVQDDRGSKDNVNVRLSNLDATQAALDHGHSLLRSLLDSSEKTLPSTNTKGCQVIRQETETAKSDYENILTQLSQVKRNLETALSHWDDFDRLHQQLQEWIGDVDVRLASDPEFKADLPEKRSSLEKYRALQADVVAHKELIDRLAEKAQQVKDGIPRSQVAELQTRYAKLQQNSKDVVGKVEDQVSSHEEYRKSYISCLDWLANTKHRLQRLSDFSGDKRSLQDRLQQLRDFKADLQQGQDMLNRTASLGERVCHTTAPRGQEVIRRELQSLRDDWAAFSTAVADVESNLESCIANWLQLDDEQSGFMGWLERMDTKIKSFMEPRPNLIRKRQHLQEGEDLYSEIVRHKAELDKVRDKGDAIVQRSSDPRVSNNMMQLYTKYQSLCSSAKAMVAKLRDNVDDHKQYDDALESAGRWLATMSERVSACSDTSGDWHVVQDRIEEIKDVTNSMDDGLAKVNYVCDQAEKILPNTSIEGKKLIEEQVTELTNDWVTCTLQEKLNKAISECTTMLEGVQQRWHEYEQYYGSLVRWLADTENTLRADPEPRALLVERKAQLDKYKLILSDIENHQRLVNELTERVANLEALCDNPEVTASLEDVQSRYNTVLYKAKECEKWLLQMSFRLMAHNSLNVSTMELTERQIEKHRSPSCKQVLLREIEDYRLTLDSVSRLGQQLIMNNARVPRLAQQVQAQLQNLEESYMNLQTTAQQIRAVLDHVDLYWYPYYPKYHY
nr:hypothetical protein BaRGS_009394 [Batillaria attramentaria]